MRTFGWAVAATGAALLGAVVLGGASTLGVVAILIVLEVSLSFDNAVVNASVLDRMSRFWQQMFLTVGMVIAVFGMRLVFPLLIVGVTAHLGPVEAVRLALRGGTGPGTYADHLAHAHGQIAAFGGLFLLMLFLDFVLTEREHVWLGWLERPLARVGRLDQVSVVVALVVLCVLGTWTGEEQILYAGALGMLTYLLVDGLGKVFEASGGGAGLMLFVYLNVLDAAFSFDGVIGAFAITQDIVVIAVGLGVGALWIRSLTLALVRRGTLGEYVYLEHGAMWAIGALAVILLVSLRHEVPEVVTGLVGVGFIAAAFASSLRRRRRVAPGPAAAPPR